MARHEATFEIDSKGDAYAVRRILEQTYDTVREESQTVRAGSEDADELLDTFRSLREAAASPSPGTLRIVYERTEEPFDG